MWAASRRTSVGTDQAIGIFDPFSAMRASLVPKLIDMVVSNRGPQSKEKAIPSCYIGLVIAQNIMYIVPEALPWYQVSN